MLRYIEKSVGLESEDDGYSMRELVLSVAVSAFLSGFFTTYSVNK